MPRPRNTGQQVEQRRRQIVEGARRCFALRGFHGAGVEDLERSCGFTRGTLFRYFPTKAAILSAVIESEAHRREAAFEAALAAAEGASLEAAAAALVAAQLRLSRDDPWSLRLRLELKTMATGEAGISRTVARLERQLRAWRRELVLRLKAQGFIHPGWDPELATDLVSAVFLGLSAEQAYDFPRGASDEALAAGAAHMLATVLGGVPPRPRSGAGRDEKRATRRS